MIYGNDKTIHRTGQLDVETDCKGNVVAVWFRCMALPFRQSVSGTDRAEEMRRMYRNVTSVINAIDVDFAETKRSPVFVLAGTHAEFWSFRDNCKTYCGIEPKDCLYVQGQDTLRGVTGASGIRIGTWFMRDKAIRDEYARSVKAGRIKDFEFESSK